MNNFTSIDLETLTNTSLQTWQKEVLNNVYGGIKRGELMTFSSGRQTGKTAFTAAALKKLLDDMESLDPNFEVLTTGTVDGTPWYTIACKKDVSIWIRENGAENSEWVDYIDEKWMYHRNKLDVSREMLAMIKLRWGG
jgi:hypothetical protein